MPHIIIMSGDRKGDRIEIDRDTVSVGRASDNAVLLDDPSCSGHHLSIIRDGKKYSVRDHVSTNGTFLNDQRIIEGRIKPKDKIVAGEVELLFDGEDVEIETPQSTAPPTARIAAVKPGAAVRPAPIGDSSPFGARRSHRGIWIALGAIVLVLVIIAGYIFVDRLLKL